MKIQQKHIVAFLIITRHSKLLHSKKAGGRLFNENEYCLFLKMFVVVCYNLVSVSCTSLAGFALTVKDDKESNGNKRS